MTRTKRAARKGQGPIAERGDNSSASAKKKKPKKAKVKKTVNLNSSVTKKSRQRPPRQKKAQASVASVTDLSAITMDEPIVISDDDDVFESTEVSTSLAASDKKRKRELKDAAARKKNPELFDGLVSAFDSKLAVMLRIHPGSTDRKLLQALIKHDASRKLFFNTVFTCPLTHSAWVTQGKIVSVAEYFIICIFPNSAEAKHAQKQLERLFSFPEYKEQLTVQVSLKSWKSLGSLATSLEPDKAYQPRGSQGGLDKDSRAMFEAFKSEVTRILSEEQINAAASDHSTKTTATVSLNATSHKRSTAEPLPKQGPIKFGFSAPAPPSMEKKRTPLPLEEPQTVRPLPSQAPSQSENAHTPQISTNASAITTEVISTADDVNMPADFQPLDYDPDLTVAGTKPTVTYDDLRYPKQIKFDANAMDQMSWSDLVKDMRLQIGERADGTPIYGCNICNQRSHLYLTCPNRICVFCKKRDDHIEGACLPPAKKCTKCKQYGHTIDECTHILHVTDAEAVCQRCGEEGHWDDTPDAECPARLVSDWKYQPKPEEKWPIPPQQVCYICASCEHFTEECSKGDGKPNFTRNGKKFNMKYYDPDAPLTNIPDDVLQTFINRRGPGFNWAQFKGYDQVDWSKFQPPRPDPHTSATHGGYNGQQGGYGGHGGQYGGYSGQQGGYGGYQRGYDSYQGGYGGYGSRY